jgi:uncharacterized C2H2 Zn-finger protein
MSVINECPRCKQIFASRLRLQSHLNRKKPCLLVGVPLETAVRELDTVIDKPIKDIEALPMPQILTHLDLPLDANTGNTTAILGASKMGKSTLMMYLYRKYYTKHVSILFTESPQIGAYKNDGKLIIGQHFYPDLVRMAHRLNKGTKNKYPFLFMLDDVVDQKENVVLKKMILVLRNSNISTIISLQDSKLFQKGSRSNVNNLIFFRYGTAEATEPVIRSFLSTKIPGTMEQKIKFYQDVTADHGFIYYNPREDRISFHRLSL